MEFELGVYELWVGRDSGFIKASSMPPVVVRGGASVDRQVVVVEVGAALSTCAHVGGIGGDQKYYEDPDGEPKGVPQTTKSLACFILSDSTCFHGSIHFLGGSV
ncbi:Hypothetical predicted protein [Olea europaea subsp. europaea]|uniref:Uncharacterized protein n=1 Tax=Olea europaea subsp. europaea TaxID=158383 RepID=A0A8S0QVJ5_OLEEU|nr:Hypothetical predicted protein [Olea europaea subsp. europaea]